MRYAPDMGNGTIRALLAVTKNRFVQMGTAVVFVLSSVGLMSDGFTAWGWLQNWRAALPWVHTPYFIWGLALASLSLIAFGIWQVVKAARVGSLVDESRLTAQSEGHAIAVQSIREIIEPLAMISNELLNHFATRDRSNRLSAQMQHAQEAARVYGLAVTDGLNGVYAHGNMNDPARHYADLMCAVTRGIGAIHRELGQVWDMPAINIPPAVHLVRPPMHRGPLELDPANNDDFFNGHHATWQRLRGELQALNAPVWAEEQRSTEALQRAREGLARRG